MGDTIKAMTQAVRGRVISPSDSDYDAARVVYNGMHDRKPRAVIQCMDAADVMAAVAAGRDGGFDLAIRGGGHSVPGFGTVDGGLVIDLSPMKNVRSTRSRRSSGSAAVQRGVMSTMPPTRSAWPRPAGSSRRPGWVA